MTNNNDTSDGGDFSKGEILSTLPKEFRIYRPNGSGNGAASRFQLSYKPESRYDKWLAFIMIAPQIGKDENENAKFEWSDRSKSITVKLGENDLGEILAVLTGQQNSINGGKGLYHKTANGNKTLKLDYNQERNSFNLQVSAQDNEKNVNRLFHGISIGEATVLSIWLKGCIEIIYNL